MRDIKGTKVSRRSFLTGAAAALGAMALNPSLKGLHLPSVTSAAAEPLHVMSWSYHPEIIQENLKIFQSTYNEPDVFYEQAPSGSIYADLLTAKFLGGELLDLAYVDEFYANRLYRAGYIAVLDDFPEAATIKDGVFPVGLESMTSSDGKLIGLPYWSGPEQLVMHAGHMDKAGLKPPDTWEEFVDQCRTLKGKGIAQYPYLPQWAKSGSQIDWNLYAELYSEGDYLFDDNLQPTFKDGGIALQKTLERWKLLWDEKLVPPDIFTIPGEGVMAYATGQYTFHFTHEYDQKVFNDPAQSKMAGMCVNIASPGKVKTTFVDSAMYCMGAKNHDPERAWKLLRWFGWKDPATKEFQVDRKWALLFGLGTVIKEIANDPEVVADWKKWKDVDMYNKQMERGRARKEMKQLWYNEWNEFVMATAQDAITGKTSVGDAVKAIYDKVITLQKSYPKV